MTMRLYQDLKVFLSSPHINGQIYYVVDLLIFFTFFCHMVAHYVVTLHNGEGEVGQAEGVGRNEGEGEPDQPSGDETPHAVRGFGGRT